MSWAIIKIELIKQEKWYGHNFSLKKLGIHSGNSALDNSNWDKINDSFTHWERMG